MRRLGGGDKKLRGIPRRLRALKKWSESYVSEFPCISDQDYSYGYWNEKIPVHMALVQGRQTNCEIQSTCAQLLIDAAYNIFMAKTDAEKNIAVTCCIVLPDMFASELCLFTAKEYFNLHTKPGESYLGRMSLLKNRSLINEWGLHLPEGFSELGVLREKEDCDGGTYCSEKWFFGELNLF